MLKNKNLSIPVLLSVQTKDAVGPAWKKIVVQIEKY